MTDEQYQTLLAEMKNIHATCTAILIFLGVFFGTFLMSRNCPW